MPRQKLLRRRRPAGPDPKHSFRRHELVLKGSRRIGESFVFAPAIAEVYAVDDPSIGHLFHGRFLRDVSKRRAFLLERRRNARRFWLSDQPRQCVLTTAQR